MISQIMVPGGLQKTFRVPYFVKLLGPRVWFLDVVIIVAGIVSVSVIVLVFAVVVAVVNETLVAKTSGYHIL